MIGRCTVFVRVLYLLVRVLYLLVRVFWAGEGVLGSVMEGSSEGEVCMVGWRQLVESTYATMIMDC